MQKCRTREFNVARNKNLSQTFSQISRSSNCNQSLYRETAFNQSSTPFQKKQKVPVCTNCVNKKIVHEKQEIVVKERQQALLETQRKKTQYQNYRDRGQEMRMKLSKQASIYNQTVAQRQLISVQSAKQLDTLYMKEVCQREKQQAQLDQRLENMRRQKEQKYRKQLKQQYDAQKTSKVLEKQAKLKQQPPKPLIKGYSSRHLRIKYAEDLRKQIQKDRRRKEQSKLLAKEVEKMAISYAEEKLLDYSEFKTQRSAYLNPQIFQEMKELEQKRKQQKEQQRISKQQERKEQQAKKHQEMLILAKQSMDATKAYASVLQKQIRNKQNEKSYERQINQQFKEDLPFAFTEEYTTPKQACGQCQAHVEERALTYY